MFIPSFFFATIHIVYLNDFCHSYRATGQFRPFFLIVYYNAATAVHALQNAIQQIDDVDIKIETQTHWFTFDEKSIESVAQAVTNLAIQFGDSDDDGNAHLCSR